ncbi:hypothetical protein SteCoe_14785 [Stentor coeruleus]|uniref:Uncharacterized protein n=1 Tax=Stentor coeruleus TaxID=5963 RepID=A0A1R2C5A5_9CILI|nr:hypothetical protein SteCoe_14785 [Stentor coeruleus]
MKGQLILPSEVKESLILNDLASLEKFHLLRGKAYGKKGKTILHYAAKYCSSTEILSYCTKTLKVNPFAVSKRGKLQAIHVSCIYGKLNIAKHLISLPEACLETVDIDGETPLSLASKHNHTDLAVFLLEKGANVSHKNKQSWTPIHWACKNGNTVLVHYLLKAGANTNFLTANGENCLHLAAESGCVHTVELMLTCIFPLSLSKKGSLLHHCYKKPEVMDYVLENTPWKNFPKLPILLEINAPVNIIVKHCAQELQTQAFVLVLRYDRDDLIKELYFRHLIQEAMIMNLTQVNMGNKCRATVVSLSRWQAVKKILFVITYAKESTCILGLKSSLIRELISCL